MPRARSGIRRALLRSAPGSDRLLRFEAPREELVAASADELPGLLERAERASSSGLWAVGFVGYEAAPGFDRALSVRPSSGPAPVAAFSMFEAPSEVELTRLARDGAVSRSAPRWSETEYSARVDAIRTAIAEGATYQVNLVFPIDGDFTGSAEGLFASLLGAGEAPYAALLEGDGWVVVSISPELFFERTGRRIAMRPMKGTRARGRFGAEDERISAELAASEKDRAENLMIVDMVRNDLGRIARPGSVEVERRFDVERYPTVWQMTSTVAAESDASLAEVFGALFPCASVTGAPKPATMRLLHELEPDPRGVYCGAVGFVAPDGDARFSVAIRTLEIDAVRSTFRYGVGSGVTWDSRAEAEWQECLDKARVLEGAPPEFELLETMRFRPDRGVELLDLHLERLAASADYFGFATSRERIDSEVRRRILDVAAELAPTSHRVRLLMSRAGEVRFECAPFEAERRPWSVAISETPVRSDEIFSFHKTTQRDHYESVRREAPGHVDEVLLVNERGELTEGTRTNLFVLIGEQWLTPPREAGLLAGVFRESLLRSGKVVEATLYPRDLERAVRVRLGNALRGWVVVEGAGRLEVGE